MDTILFVGLLGGETIEWEHSGKLVIIKTDQWKALRQPTPPHDPEGLRNTRSRRTGGRQPEDFFCVACLMPDDGWHPREGSAHAESDRPGRPPSTDFHAFLRGQQCSLGKGQQDSSRLYICSSRVAEDKLQWMMQRRRERRTCSIETLSRVQAAEGQSLIGTVKLTGECLPCPEIVLFFAQPLRPKRTFSTRECLRSFSGVVVDTHRAGVTEDQRQ